MIRQWMTLWRTWRVSQALDEGRADDPAIQRLIERDPAVRRFHDDARQMGLALGDDAADWLAEADAPAARRVAIRSARRPGRLLWRVGSLAVAAMVLLGLILFTSDLADQPSQPIRPTNVTVVLETPNPLIEPSLLNQPYATAWSQLRDEGRAVLDLALSALPGDPQVEPNESH
jgi:hypothetical protein